MTAHLDARVVPLLSPVAGVHIRALRLDPRPGDLRAADLDASDRERLAAARGPEGDRLLARRSLTRAAIAGIIGGPPDAVATSSAGGPHTAHVPGAAPWFMSLSSSGSWALLALAAVPVGVDVERLPGPPDALQVSEHLLATTEHAWIAAGGSAGGPDVPARFLATWVRKEAVVKCTGEGMSRDLRSFVVDASAAVAEVRDAEGGPLGIRTMSVSFPGHEAALALAGSAAPGA